MSVQQHNEEEVVGDPMIWSASIPPRLREQARVSYAIPVQFLASLYPSEHAGVYEALNFQTPSISTTPCTVTPEGFFSRDPPTPITLATLTRLRTLRIPPKIVVNQLQNLSRQAWLNGNLSIVYAHISTSTVTHFPLWVIAYWKGVIDQHAARQNWVAATGWLATELRGKKGEARRATARDVRVLLESTPWQVQQQGMEETEPLHQAARRLLGPCYTSDGDLNNLLHLLNLEVSRDVHLMRRVRVESTHFTTRLIEAYNNRDDYKSNKKYQWLHDVGNDIFTHHQRLVSVAHLNGLTDSQDDVEEHWAAVVLDAEHLTLRFGDSLGQRMPTKMEAAYLWYVDQHSDAVFDVHTLPITKQADSHSCGPLAYNACAHEVFPGREGLCLPRDAIMLRLQLFAMICKRTLEMMPIGDEGPGPIAELQHFPFTFESPLVPALPSAEGASLGPDDQMACALPDAGAPQPGALAGGAMRDGDKSATWGGDGSATWGSDEMDYGSISSVSMHSHCDDDALTLEAPTDVHSAPSTSYLGPVLDTSTDHSNEGCADSEPNPPKLKKSRLATSLKAVVSGAFVQMKATITTKPAQERKHATLRGFFPVEDKEQHAERLAREFEELRETREERDRLEREQAAEATAAKRANDRLRQQRSRAKRRALAAQADGDGDGGTAAGKKRKRTLVERDVSPEDLNIAEASRPARKIRKVDNDKNKKNTGRPRKKEHKEAKRTNWHVPLLWAAIDDAAQRSGIGPWRASQIYRRTQQNILLRDLKEQVIGRWIERGTRSWKAAVLAKVEDQRNRGNLPGGQSTRSGILEPYPDLRQKIKDHLEGLRNAGVGLTLVGIRAIMIARIRSDAPELFSKVLHDNTRFRCSEAFVKGFLRRMGWSQRKATRAAQKLPENHEQLVYESLLREAHVVRDYNVHPALRVNTDQTYLVYQQNGDSTWTKAGVKQVSVLGADEKRAFTLVPGISASGEVLPFQAVFAGSSDKSRPNSAAPCYAEAIDLGFKFVSSMKSSNHWSTIATMKAYVNDILVPYLTRKKVELGLPDSQQSVWHIDCWSVHRSEEFLTWMKSTHPTITVIFVPGGCTGIFQPLDVGIQRIMKHSMRRSALEDLVEEAGEKMARQAAGTQEEIKLATTVGVLRNRSVRWMVQSYHELTPELVRRAFELCRAEGFNLGHASLTSPDVLKRLRELPAANPALFKQLSSQAPVPTGEEEDPIDEEDDHPADLRSFARETFQDASDVPTNTVIDFVMSEGSQIPPGFCQVEGNLMRAGVAEDLDVDDVSLHEAPELMNGGKPRKGTRTSRRKTWKANWDDMEWLGD